MFLWIFCGLLRPELTVAFDYTIKPEVYIRICDAFARATRSECHVV
jgi:hypothetical protein